MFSNAINGYESLADSDIEGVLLAKFTTTDIVDYCGLDSASALPKLSLVIRHNLSVKVSNDGQRDNLFYTRVTMGHLSVSVVIESGSFSNSISSKDVQHFALKNGASNLV